MDIFEKRLFELHKQQRFRAIRQVSGPCGPKITLDGMDVLSLCSNDYLGLANHPKLKQAATDAIKKYGFGAGAARLICGAPETHLALEQKIAAFKGCEAALVFNTGYAANCGILPALMRRGDIIYSDRLNHASIVDGCLLSRATIRRFRHTDTNHLSALLTKDTQNTGADTTRLIVTEGVFSMDGDIAPLPEMTMLAKKHNALIMLDDAHGTGVLGNNGKGSREFAGIDETTIDIQMGTLSKALGAFGAYVAGSKQMIDYFINFARPFIYSTALPPSVTAAASVALDIVESESDRRKTLLSNAHILREGLKNLGFNVSAGQTPIIPVIIGKSEKAVEMMNALLDEGVYAVAIRPPTVPENTARIRVTITAGHSLPDLDFAISAFKKAGRRCGLI